MGTLAVAVAPAPAAEEQEQEQEQGQSAVNGTASGEEAIKAGQQPVIGEPVAVNGVADSTPAVEAVANGAALAKVASPASDKFVDAPTEPIASPDVVVPEVQNLSLEEEMSTDDEKKPVEVAEAPIPNGKPVATA